MRATVLLLAAVLIAPTVSGQSLESRIDAVRSGTVRFSFAAQPGVCGNGRGSISIRQSDGGTTTGTVSTRRTEWEDECEPGPVRIAVDREGGRVTGLRAYVGGRWRGEADADLGMVEPSEATDWLLLVAKDVERPKSARTTAIFWVGQAAAEAATAGLSAIVDEPEGDREVRKSAVFALSQRPKDESVPALIRIAKTHRDPELRRTAIFWLGQSKDSRALAYFEDVLAR